MSKTGLTGLAQDAL